MPTCPTPSKIQPADTFEKRLNAYALAGATAGVGLLALVQPSAAEVVYTPVHVVIGVGGVKDYNLDLDGDGVIDFAFETRNRCDTDQCFSYLFVTPQKNDGAIGYARGSFFPLAAALNLGAPIGPNGKFLHPRAAMASWYLGGGGSSSHGQWANVKNRYLGLAFRINGEVHFGWARFSVRDEPAQITGLLTGYAYETVAARPIRAGQTSDAPEVGSIPKEIVPEDFEQTMPASLGILALGSLGLDAWRRNQQ